MNWLPDKQLTIIVPIRSTEGGWKNCSTFMSLTRYKKVFEICIFQHVQNESVYNSTKIISSFYSGKKCKASSNTLIIQFEEQKMTLTFLVAIVHVALRKILRKTISFLKYSLRHSKTATLEPSPKKPTLLNVCPKTVEFSLPEEFLKKLNSLSCYTNFSHFQATWSSQLSTKASCKL